MFKQNEFRNLSIKLASAAWMIILLFILSILIVTTIASATDDSNASVGAEANAGTTASLRAETDDRSELNATTTPETTHTATLPSATPEPTSQSSPTLTPTLTPTPTPTPPPFETEYLIGIIDVTSGQIQPPAATDEYSGEYYLDGRVAFYLKGKLKGKYLLTAQLDTGEGPLGETFERLAEKDPRTLFEKIDPDRYYPVYGDNSTILNDAESQGRLYVRLEWDRSRIILGNYRMDVNETELFKYNRGLYGLQLVFRKATPPASIPTAGDETGTQIFWADPLTYHSHDELLATGGSLYYLKRADLVIGSEKVIVEVRNALTGRVITTLPLENRRDYDLDYVQGRLILKRDLTAIIHTGLITTAEPLEANPLYLIADYEYESTMEMANTNYGLRTSQNFGKLRLGATYLKDNTTAGSDYQLKGADLNLGLGPNLSLNAEWAGTQQSFSNRFYSQDGGLTYTEAPSGTAIRDSATAWEIGAKWVFPEDSSTKLELNSYYISEAAGFSTPGAEILNNTQTYGLEFGGKLREDYTLLSKFNVRNEENTSADTTAAIQVSRNYELFKLTGELRYQDLNDFTSDTSTKNLLGAARLDYSLNDKTNLYGGQQLSLPLNDTTFANNRTTLGVEYNLNTQTLLTGETSFGDLGTSALLGLNYQASKENQVYSRVQYQNDPSKGQTITSVLGNRGRLSETVELFTEYQTGFSETESSDSELLGLNYTPRTGWLLWFNYTRSLVDSRADARDAGAESTQDIDRNIFGLGVSHQTDNLEYKTGLQLRSDDGTNPSLDQYLMTNSLKGRFNESLSYYTKLNYSITKVPNQGSELARFGEGSLGLAYRPIANDRFNLLGEYTYLLDIAPSGQADAAFPGERSQTLAVDFIYDINNRWELGEKLAYKKAELKQDFNLDQWTANELYMWVNRLNYHLPFNWELSLEYRKLWDTQAMDSQEGFLTALYYYFSVNTKLGGGYNFTSFNDDLVHLNINARGWFVNFTQQW